MLSVISITMVEYYWVGTKGEGSCANCKPPLEFGFGHVTKYTNVLHRVLLIPVFPPHVSTAQVRQPHEVLVMRSGEKP